METRARRKTGAGRAGSRFPALNKLYDRYRGRVAFYAVYIEEAHPSDLWQMGSNVREGVVLASPKTDAERVNVAGSCVRNLGIRFPALVDGIENTVERLDTGWPDRLVLIGADGRVIYRSEAGPFGFHPEELASALEGMRP